MKNNLSPFHEFLSFLDVVKNETILLSFRQGWNLSESKLNGEGILLNHLVQFPNFIHQATVYTSFRIKEELEDYI